METFVVACGMGLDARIMAGTDRHLKRRFSFVAYVASAAREIVRPAAVAVPRSTWTAT